MKVDKVVSRKDLKSFVHFPNELYRNNPFYVPQLESMDLATFDREKNHAFEVCEAEYFLAKDDAGRVLGRVAAIMNDAYNVSVGHKICRFGWIDFVDDPAVAKALLDRVEEFAREHGADEVTGPEGFLEFDVAGVLVEGFDRLPTAYGKYNAPYYDRYITDLGYRKAVDWVEYVVDISGHDPEANRRTALSVMERSGLHQAEFRNKKEVMKFVPGMFAVMNRCYSKIYGYTQLSDGQLEDLKNQFIPNVDTDLLSIVLDRNEKVVAFCIWMPSLSKALQKAKGRLWPFGFIHILRALRHNDTADALLIAVDDEYKGKGVNALFFDKLFSGAKKIGITKVETTRQLESNFRVQNLSHRYPRELVKRARAYHKSIVPLPENR